LLTIISKNKFKGTESVISSDPPSADCFVRTVNLRLIKNDGEILIYIAEYLVHWIYRNSNGFQDIYK